MDKRYQVFVSSTFEDLQEERKEVIQALLELDCIPAGMELFPASSDDQWTLIKRVIDDCDYFLLIIGGRYGSIGSDGKSYTQMEFEYALSTGKPIISFLHKDPSSITAGKSEKDPEKIEKLAQFRELTKKKLIKTWDSPANLGSVVSRSMVRLIKDFPAEGWVKAKYATDEKTIHEIGRLRNENTELKEKLQRITVSPPKDTECLAQGDDVITVSISYQGETGDFFGHEDCATKVKLTWNECFRAIAPSLLNECSDTAMQIALEAMIEQKAHSLLKKSEYSSYKKLSSFRIASLDYDQIKIQLRALGLIQLSPKREKSSSHDTYWSITPYGDHVMMQLYAIKKIEGDSYVR